MQLYGSPISCRRAVYVLPTTIATRLAEERPTEQHFRKRHRRSCERTEKNPRRCIPTDKACKNGALSPSSQIVSQLSVFRTTRLGSLITLLENARPSERLIKQCTQHSSQRSPSPLANDSSIHVVVVSPSRGRAFVPAGRSGPIGTAASARLPPPSSAPSSLRMSSVAEYPHYVRSPSSSLLRSTDPLSCPA